MAHTSDEQRRMVLDFYGERDPDLSSKPFTWDQDSGHRAQFARNGQVFLLDHGKDLAMLQALGAKSCKCLDFFEGKTMYRYHGDDKDKSKHVADHKELYAFPHHLRRMKNLDARDRARMHAKTFCGQNRTVSVPRLQTPLSLAFTLMEQAGREAWSKTTRYAQASPGELHLDFRYQQGEPRVTTGGRKSWQVTSLHVRASLPVRWLRLHLRGESVIDGFLVADYAPCADPAYEVATLMVTAPGSKYITRPAKALVERNPWTQTPMLIGFADNKYNKTYNLTPSPAQRRALRTVKH